MLDGFTLDSYRVLLELLGRDNQNLRFVDLEREAEPPRYFILRHDVDFCLQTALEMAQLEAHLGVRATYFILLGSPAYNMFSSPENTIPARLVDLGHEVGLHYDPRIQSAVIPPLEWLRMEADVLSRMAGAKVRTIAIHDPSLNAGDPFLKGTEFTNAYEARFTEKIRYFSDSCGAWRDAAVESLSARPIPDRLQILIHPFFWRKDAGDRWSRLRDFVGKKLSFWTDYRREAEDIWAAHAGVREHDARIGSSSGRLT